MISDLFHITEFYDCDSGSVYSNCTFVTLTPSGDNHPKHHKGKPMKEEWLVKMKVFYEYLREFHTHNLLIIKNEKCKGYLPTACKSVISYPSLLSGIFYIEQWIVFLILYLVPIYSSSKNSENPFFMVHKKSCAMKHTFQVCIK